MISLKEAHRRVQENDPPIEINQRWICRNAEGEVLRRLRILAKHPDGGWIYTDEPAKMIRLTAGEIRCAPEFNLRYVFELEQ